MRKEIILGLNLLALTSFPINNLGYGNEVKPPFEFNLDNNVNNNTNKNNKKNTKNQSFDEFFKKFDRDRKIKEVKEKKVQLEKTEKKTKTYKDNNYNQEFILTFYTGLACENSKHGAVTCQGKRLRDGIVANNILPLGTKIKLKGYGTVEILDRGGKNFNISNRLDVYVPREYGESNSSYYKRVNSMGRVKVKGCIVE